MNQLVIIISILLFILSGHTPYDQSNTSMYNFNSPSEKLILPDILHEISGLTLIDANTFACIQDEKGILFIYDIAKREIKKQYTFAIDGDYEGICKVEESMYVLRSDGMLLEIKDYESKTFKLNSYTTGIPANNNEGLCYDKSNNRLLIACKGKINKGPEYKDKRAIYGFDLKTKTLNKEPVFDFDLQRIKQFATDNKINLPVKTKKNGQSTDAFIKFGTSDICIHPLTKKLFLLSATDHLLFIFKMNGELEHIEQLNSTLFNKAEGITFFENGDMLITNEGQDKKPTLLRFNYFKK